MKLLIIILTLFFFGQTPSTDQKMDDFVKEVERLRKEKKLAIKVYPDKTFVGSLAGYYYKDSLVLINSLTDAEEAGTETLYYIQNGSLKKVYIMAAQFDSPEEWAGYYSKHQSTDNCFACHSKMKCIVTVIHFDKDTLVEKTSEGKILSLTKSEKQEIITYTLITSKELQALLKELE